MNRAEVPEEILSRAKEIFQHRTNRGIFPEDEWIQLDENFDFNLFILDEEFNYHAGTLYKILDGETDTSDFLPLFKEHVPDEEYIQFVKQQNAQMESDWLARQEEPLGLTYSRLNPHGVFTPDGRQIGSTCKCEDYPCCGH